MEVALITVGDELLAGDTVNTNANWLAAELSDRGVAVKRILRAGRPRRHRGMRPGVRRRI